MYTKQEKECLGMHCVCSSTKAEAKRVWQMILSYEININFFYYIELFHSSKGGLVGWDL